MIIDVSKYSDEQYIEHDPFAGDRDVDVRCRTVKIVKIRKPQECHDPMHKGRPFPSLPGTRMRSDRAVVDGEWSAAYTCLECIAQWFDEEPGAVPIRGAK